MAVTAQQTDRGVDLYLQLLARVLTRELFEDNDRLIGLPSTVIGRPEPRRVKVADRFAPLLGKLKFELIYKQPFDRDAREGGRDWPARAETMAGLKRLANARMCVESVLADKVPGDIIETGVWRGGMSIFMKAVLTAHGDEERRVWLADSFEGLPAPDIANYPADEGFDLSGIDVLAVGVDVVRRNFQKYGLLDDRVDFIVGWFRDTLATAPVDQLAILRLDGDLYESTMDALEPLYPKLSPGGYCIVDDYHALPACSAAVADYRAKHGIEEEIIDIDGRGAYWRKSMPQSSGRRRRS